MKRPMKAANRSLFLPVLAVLAACWTGPARAQTTQYASNSITWDDGITAAWGSAPGGPFSSVWTNGNDAVFEGTAGTVSIAAGGVTARSLAFTNVTGYTIQNNTLTLAGAAPTITVGTSLSASLSSVVAGTNGLVKAGAGTLSLGSGNVYTGKTVIAGGTLTIAASTSLGTYPGSLVVDQITIDGGTLGGSTDSSSGNNRGVYLGTNGATITLGQWMGPFSGPGNLIVGTAGECRLNGGSPYGAQGAYDSTYAGDTILMPGSSLRICRPLSLQNSTLDLTVALPFDFYGSSYGVLGGLKGGQNWTPSSNGFGGAPLTGGLFIGNNNKDTTYSGVLSGADTPIIKIGSGTLTLSGNNTFTAQLTVQSGALAVPSINNAGAVGPLGSNALAVIIGTTNVTATLRLTGTNSAAASDKAFTLAAGGTAVFQIDVAATTQTLSGVVSGGGNLTKTGPGTLILSGVNTSVGDVRVEGGALGLANPGISSTSSVWVATGSKLNLNFEGTNTVCSLTLGGSVKTPGLYRNYGPVSAFLGGTGWLDVTNGPPARGTLISVR